MFCQWLFHLAFPKQGRDGDSIVADLPGRGGQYLKEPQRVGIEVLGTDGFQDRRGRCFPQGGPGVTEGGCVMGACYQGPSHSVYSAGSQGEKGALYRIPISCLGEGGRMVPASPLALAKLPFERWANRSEAGVFSR